MIKRNGENLRYYDRNGREIVDGCRIKFDSGRIETVYATEGGYLGTDATNPAWIKAGRAMPCEEGIYPLTKEETECCVVL